MPKQYYQPPINHIPESKPEHKQNYIDDVLKTKKSVPGPNAYTPVAQSRPLSGKMDKRPRATLADTIMSQNKSLRTPGPGSYFTRPKTADTKINRNAP